MTRSMRNVILQKIKRSAHEERHSKLDPAPECKSMDLVQIGASLLDTVIAILPTNKYL